jgi:hypothetical protein
MEVWANHFVKIEFNLLSNLRISLWIQYFHYVWHLKIANNYFVTAILAVNKWINITWWFQRLHHQHTFCTYNWFHQQIWIISSYLQTKLIREHDIFLKIYRYEKNINSCISVKWCYRKRIERVLNTISNSYAVR